MARQKVFSTLITMLCCVAIMVLTMMVSPALATSSENPDESEPPVQISPESMLTPESSAESTLPPTAEPTTEPTAESTEAITESVTPTDDGSATESPSETSPGEMQTDTPATETPASTPAETGTPTATAKPTTTVKPTATPVPTKKPTPAPTTPPKLEILTPPALSAEIEEVTPSGSVQPDVSAPTGEVVPDGTDSPTPTHHVEHVEQVEIDPGFRMSDFIGILCYIVYGLAGLILLLGLVRIAILLIFKKDILPSKKERLKAKEEKERQDAIKRQKMIETAVTSEEYNIRKDDWNWK